MLRESTTFAKRDQFTTLNIWEGSIYWRKLNFKGRFRTKFCNKNGRTNSTQDHDPITFHLSHRSVGVIYCALIQNIWSIWYILPLSVCYIITQIEAVSGILPFNPQLSSTKDNIPMSGSYDLKRLTNFRFCPERSDLFRLPSEDKECRSTWNFKWKAPPWNVVSLCLVNWN